MSGPDTDKLGGRGLSSAPVYVSDLGRCEPPEAISRTSERRRWRAYDYEVGGFGGVMLMAGPETEAPDITYPLEVDGWHAVSIGFYSTIPGLSGVSDFLVRLSGDDTFSVLDPIRADVFEQQGQLEEIYWKTADLTDQQIVFGQLSRRRAPGDHPGVVECGPVRIAYVKLVPLTAAEAEEHERDVSDGENKRLYAHNDSFSFQNEYRPTTAEAIRRQIEPYRDTDFSRIYWEVGSGDTLYYPSKVGRNWDTIDLPRDYGRMADRLRDEAWRIQRADGVDIFQVALDHAHEIGLEMHGAYRLAGWTYPPPTLSYAFEGGMWEKRPDLRCLDRDGRFLPRLSYAFREVQDYALSVLREAAQYPLDGLALLYNRRPPYIMYEQPLIDGFQEEHGEDPRSLDEFEPTWLAYRAGVVTEFMRRVRAELDAVAEEQGRGPIQITACVLGKVEDNTYFGLDTETWAKEGLIDTLIPYSPAPLAMPIASDIWSSPDQVEPFVSMVKGTDCGLSLNVMPRDLGPEEYRRMASMLYGAGAESMFFWDTNARCTYRPPWAALRRLGHREEIEAWMQAGEPDLGAVIEPLRSLAGWNMEAIAPG